MTIQIQNDELDAILQDVETAVKPLLKSERDRLAKAGEGSPPPAEEESPEPSPEASPEASSAPPEASPEASAAPEASAGGPPPGPEGSAPPEDDGFPQDPAQLHAMIAQLPPEQVQALYLASKQVLQSQRGAGAGGPPPGPEASAGGPPPPPAAPPAGPPAMKAEMRPSPGNGGKAIKKSENQENDMSQKELEEMKKLVKAQGEQMEVMSRGMEALLTRVVGAPMRKSMTAVSQASVKPGSEPEAKALTKAEVGDRLKEKIQAKNLSKKDRAAIYAFYDTGANDLTKIAHLLKD